MSLGFGLLSAQRVAGDPRTWEDVYRETLDLAAHAETAGFGSVWTTEHHFVDDGYMPSLLVTSAAIAARTSTIRIGTGVLLAPLHDPLRLAEDAATVQAIADGRLDLGLGLGWSTTEFEALRVDKSQRGASMTEILQILQLARSGDPFTWSGSVYDLPTVGIRPAPAVPIPLIVGGGVDAAVRRAARYADGFFSNASPSRFVDQIAVAHEEMERIGRDPATFRWIYSSVMYPGDLDEVLESVWHQMWKYSDMEASASRQGIAATPPLTPDMADRLRTRVLSGSSQQIVDAIGELRAGAGVPVEWVARSYFPDFTFPRQTDVLDTLATEVMPFLPTG
jgi:alkanesulfonate monooxygenase SsuD/methylene tetrahydromethanopterin reductase-like flavin-dependent oxidoreductase (luciferase family)